MTVLSDLRMIFSDWQAGLRDFLGRPAEPSRYYFLKNHLLLCLHAPFFAALAPLPWIRGGHFSYSMRLILPLVLPVFFVALAMVLERIAIYEKGPSMEEPRGKNALLYLTLPACSAGIFYFVHPLLGILLTLAFGMFSIVACIRAAMEIWSLSFDRVLFRLAGAFLFLMTPILALLAIRNVLQSLGILNRLLHG